MRLILSITPYNFRLYNSKNFAKIPLTAIPSGERIQAKSAGIKH